MAATKSTIGADIRSPVSPTFSSPTASKLDKSNANAKRASYTANYAAAFSDTYGVVGEAPFIYKTGPAWPQRTGGPNAQPYLREMRPVAHTHPIKPQWIDIIKNIETYFTDNNMQLNIVAGLAFANQKEEKTFCELVVVIGVPQTGFEFADVKAAADYTQGTILTKAGFPDVPVAVREWEVNLHGAGPKLPSLDPPIDGDITEFRHPFSSNPGLAVALLKQPGLEGTAGAYFRLGSDREVILALTCCHVACPAHTGGLTLAEAAAHHKVIVALGSGAYEAGTTSIMERIGTLQGIITSQEDRIAQLARRLANGNGDPDAIAEATEVARHTVERMRKSIGALNRLHDWATKRITHPNQRRIGRILYADPIGPSSDPAPHTVDWAFIQIDQDAFGPGFTGNKVFIGGKVQEEDYCKLMFPYASDRATYAYPKNGLLQIFGFVPESEMLMPTQLGANGDPRMPVIKNGRTTGTTVGWLNGLDSLVRHYDFEGADSIKFTAMETTIVPYGGRGAFSSGGDSGSVILDRKGRIVGLLTGGGGLTNETDITFATAGHKLFPRIEQAVPGVFLLPEIPSN